MSSICGVDCNKCQMKEECNGCFETKGRPFKGECVLATCCYKEGENTSERMERYKNELIKELNSLGIEDMPEIKELYSLKGSFVNVEYTLSNGQKIKLLEDDNIYLGNQLPKKNSNRCYGIAADNNYLLVCEYGENGIEPEIIIYKKRG